MNRCASCRAEIPEVMLLCPHHHAGDIGWSATNRIMCDLLHRGAVPPRVSAAERADDLRGCLREAA
jgi:hypothetical protein